MYTLRKAARPKATATRELEDQKPTPQAAGLYYL